MLKRLKPFVWNTLKNVDAATIHVSVYTTFAYIRPAWKWAEHRADLWSVIC